MTHDEELIERVKDQVRDVALLVDTEVHDIALAAIAAVRAYDREQRAKIDAAMAEFYSETVTDHDVIEGQKEFAAVDALVERFDPDDYRDLPVSMTADVRFKGGLTEG